MSDAPYQVLGAFAGAVAGFALATAAIAWKTRGLRR